MIPDAAVEAAREQLEQMGIYLSPKYARAALEAAAPHMLVESAESLAADIWKVNEAHTFGMFQGDAEHLAESLAAMGYTRPTP